MAEDEMMRGYLAFGAAFVLYIALMRLVKCIPYFKKKKQCSRHANDKTALMIILGSGGHTAEMLSLLSGFPDFDQSCYSPLHVVTAASDKTSIPKLQDWCASNQKNMKSSNVLFHSIPRSREVGQSYFTSIFTTVYSLFHSFKVVLLTSPDLIICNGPGTCIPICFSAFLLNFLGINHTRLIFVESFCRVKYLSLTGKLLYYIADRFIVQWETLAAKYPRAEYIGVIF